MKRFIILIIFVGILGAMFHGLGLFQSAPWHIVYSDLLGFFNQATDPAFPYLEKQIEYPVITGLFIHLMGQLAWSRTSYYVVSVIVLIGFAMLATRLLYKMVPPEHQGRLFRYWIFAPSMLIFLLYNWDIITLLFVILAFYYIEKKQDVRASVFLALGFVSKLYPVLYLAPLLIKQSSWKERFKIVGTFGATALIANIFFMIKNFNGWHYFITLNQTRSSNLDSIWTVIRFLIRPFENVALLNSVSLVLFIALFGFVLWRYRTRSTIVLCFAGTVIFLLTNKVFSPQYALWLLPFFVLLPIFDDARKKKWFYVFEFSNSIAAFLALSWLLVNKHIGYFYGASIFVMIRHALLVAFLVTALHSKEYESPTYQRQ